MKWQKVLQAAKEAQRAGKATTTLRKEEIAQRATDFYEQQLKAGLESSGVGKFVVIDAETLDYAVAKDDVTASLTMLEKDPSCGPRLFGIRVGFKTAYRIGSRQAGIDNDLWFRKPGSGRDG